MKLIAVNLLAVCFLVLAGLLVYWGKGGWGWCLAGAFLSGHTFETKDIKKDEGKPND